ncbi:MAG: site-specific integrase, partial [Clostridia bacterium]
MEAKTTRNAQGGGTIRKRSDGRWEARYTIGIDPGTGKQIQKSVYGQTQKEVRQRLSKATTELDEGEYFEPTRMTVGQWIDIWLTDYTDDKKYLTVKHYKAQCKAHIKASLGAIRLADLTAPVIQRFYNSLLRGEPPLSPKSVRNIHGILTKALSTAVKVGYLKANPAALVTLPRVPKTEIQPLTDPQVEAFLKITEEEKYGLLFKVILFTGIREGEAIGLTWDSVNFQTGVISINKQLQKRPKQDGGFVFAPLKNDKVRSIAPAPFVMALLRQRRNEEARQRLLAGAAWEGWHSDRQRETAPVFTNEFGAHLHPQTVYNHFKKLVVQIGAPQARVHDLRHTFAVLSIQNGDDIKTIQGNLGHATAAFTLDVYGHVSEKMKKDSADRMEQYI